MSWDGSKTAVLLTNSDTSKKDLTLKLADVPGMTGPCDVRDLWAPKDLGNHADTVTVSVESHDAAFLLLSGCTFAPTPPPPAQSTVVNPTSGKCLDIYNNEFKDEAKVEIYSCNGATTRSGCCRTVLWSTLPRVSAWTSTITMGSRQSSTRTRPRSSSTRAMAGRTRSGPSRMGSW